jgi:hypothetical protein
MKLRAIKQLLNDNLPENHHLPGITLILVIWDNMWEILLLREP